MAEDMGRSVRRYLRANNFIDHLKKNRSGLTPAEYSQLRAQALAGDIEGAWQGLYEALAGKGIIDRRDRA